MRGPGLYAVLGALLLTARGLVGCIAVGNPEQVGCYADMTEPGCPFDASISRGTDGGVSSEGGANEADTSADCCADCCDGDAADAGPGDGASGEGAAGDAGVELGDTEEG